MSCTWDTLTGTWDSIGTSTGGIASENSSFITLVNNALRRLNEVQIANDTQFLTVTGFHAHAKDAINNAIRDINAEEFQWPFNHVTQRQTLTPGVTRYPFPASMKVVDFDTFRMVRSDLLNVRSKYLPSLKYEDYIRYYRDKDLNYDTPDWSIPAWVFRTQENQLGVTPPPDKAYVIEYEYWRQPGMLVQPSDTTTIPQPFEYVIEEGAMKYLYMFRENLAAAQLADANFRAGIKNMRIMLINRDVNVTSTYIIR